MSYRKFFKSNVSDVVTFCILFLVYIFCTSNFTNTVEFGIFFFGTLYMLTGAIVHTLNVTNDNFS